MRKFKFTVNIHGVEEVADGIIAIDQKIFDIANSEEWQSVFYTFQDDEAIASHVAWRMTIYNDKLSNIEGFCGLTDDLAKIIEHATGYDDYDFQSEEIV
jgi:hypothetical protein